MALKMVKGSIDRMFDKNLQDLVRGIRNHKEDEVSGPGPRRQRGRPGLGWLPSSLRAGCHPLPGQVLLLRGAGVAGSCLQPPPRRGGCARPRSCRVSRPPGKGDVVWGKVEAGIGRRKRCLWGVGRKGEAVGGPESVRGARS